MDLRGTPAFPSRGLFLPVPLAPEGDGGSPGGGGLSSGSATATTMAGAASKTAAPVTPATESKAAPATLAAVAKVEAPKAEAPAAKVVEAKPEPEAKAEPKPEPSAEALMRRLDALEARNAKLEEELAATKTASTTAVTEVRDRLVRELFDGVELLPKYHDIARQKIGDLDPKSDAARAKLDSFVKEFPEAVKPRGEVRQPNSAWLDRITNAQKDAKSTRGTMLGAISASQLGELTGRRS